MRTVSESNHGTLSVCYITVGHMSGPLNHGYFMREWENMNLDAI